MQFDGASEGVDHSICSSLAMISDYLYLYTIFVSFGKRLG